MQRCVLQHASISEALAALLSGKVHETLPGSLAYSTVGGSRAETATAEEALRSTMAEVFERAEVRRAVVSDLIKVLVVDPAADGLLQPYLFFKGFHALSTYRVASQSKWWVSSFSWIRFLLSLETHVLLLRRWHLAVAHPGSLHVLLLVVSL